MGFGKDKHEGESLGERIKEKVKDVFGKNDDDKQTTPKTSERLSDEAGDGRRSNVPTSDLQRGVAGVGAGGAYGSSAAGGQGRVNVPDSDLQYGATGTGGAYGSSVAEGAGGRINVAGQDHDHHHRVQHGSGLTSSQYGDARRIDAPGNDDQLAGGAYGAQHGAGQRGSGHEEQGLLGRAKETVKDTFGSGDRDSRGATAGGYETRSKTTEAVAGYGQRVGQVGPQAGLSPQQGAYAGRREF